MKIIQLKNGEYYTRLRLKVNGSWSEKRLRDVDKNNLIYRASKLKKQAEENSLNLKKWRLEEFFNLFFDTYKKGKVSHATEDLYTYAYEELIDYFGNVFLESITKLQYQQFINYLGQDSALNTVITRHRKARAMFNIAVALNYMKMNPATGAKMAGKDLSKEKSQFMEADKVGLLIAELQTSFSVARGVILLAVQTGMRYEELIALTWFDIDLKNRKIMVNKAWDYKYTKTFCSTKNKKSREIYIDNLTVNYLIDYKEWQKSYVEKNNIPNDLSLLFSTQRGFPIDNASCNKSLKKICKSIGADKLTLHKLRHTHTVQCTEAGMDIIYTSERLGHTDINTTLKYYTHLSKKIRDSNESKVDTYFSRKISATKTATKD
ncbi:site-specific integrase [Listeria booriae]|uniref:tyrosine-type recombinase/integrase n=2 Tax=Listeria TaxID=1637 RepID=UPI00164DE9E0|nr:site-specific integrase [Listeria booriae]MBC6165325.1 site-specific integrase [Listeria booriae]